MSNQTLCHNARTWISVLLDLAMFLLRRNLLKAGWDRSIKVLMVSVRFNLFALHQWNNFYLLTLRPKFSLIAELHTASFINEIQTWNASVKGLQIVFAQVCKILKLNLFADISCSPCVLPLPELKTFRYHVLLVHSSFGRCVHRY